MNKSVHIIVLNYKNYADTIRCIESLLRVSYSPTTIVVVDNDSRNGSLDKICKYLGEQQREPLYLEEDQDLTRNASSRSDIVVIQALQNRGYAAGNNIGIRYAISRKADYVLILNNDTIVPTGFLEPLVAFADKDPSIAMVGPKVTLESGQVDRSCARRRPTYADYFFRLGVGKRLFPENRWIKQHFLIGEYEFAGPREVDLISGCCMLIKTVNFIEDGLLDEHTFLGLEEHILHERLRRRSKKTFCVPESYITHLHGRSRKDADPGIARARLLESQRYYLRRYRECGPLLSEFLLMFLWRFNRHSNDKQHPKKLKL